MYYWNLSSQTETLGNLHGCQNKNIANKLSKQWSSEKWTQISLEFLFLWCLYIKLHEIRAKRPQNFIWFSASFSSVHADNNINKHFYFATNKTESVFCLPSTSIKIVVFIIVFFLSLPFYVYSRFNIVRRNRQKRENKHSDREKIAHSVQCL